jgi:ABC-2 type transport system ATP-binding protein
MSLSAEATVPAVSVRSLRKSYGAHEALRGVDLDIEAGEIFALLGPNGAGKTTFVEILEGYRRRSGGEATVLGRDPGHADASWKARIGIVPQSTSLIDDLTVEELVGHFAGFYPSTLGVSRTIGLVGLEEKRGARCAQLSGGQQRRVELALGIIGDPELIFLDEPTTGLDPEGRRQLWGVVRDFAQLGKTVLLTTHYLDEAEALASRVGIIIAGELAALGDPGTIGDRANAPATVRFLAAGPLANAELPALPGDVRREGQRYVISTAAPTAVVRALASWAAGHGVAELPELVVARPSLEDIYLEMIAARDETEAAR